jgi:hypothetical protein
MKTATTKGKKIPKKEYELIRSPACLLEKGISFIIFPKIGGKACNDIAKTNINKKDIPNTIHL